MADSTPDQNTVSRSPDLAPHPEGQRVCLVKGEHRWLFRWNSGDEASIIARVAEMARDPRMAFDWFDAAIVCRNVTPKRGSCASDVSSEN